MKKKVLFIQGGGDSGYKADAILVASLQEELGDDYQIIYPPIPTDSNAPDFGWPDQIGKEITAFRKEFVLVAHSLGASMLLKFLSENEVSIKATGILLIATPFWSGNEQWKQRLKLQEGFAQNLPKSSRLFFYHSRDDEEVPFDHLAYYKQNLPEATFREIKNGGHQLSTNVNVVASDIKALYDLSV